MTPSITLTVGADHPSLLRDAQVTESDVRSFLQASGSMGFRRSPHRRAMLTLRVGGRVGHVLRHAGNQEQRDFEAYCAMREREDAIREARYEADARELARAVNESAVFMGSVVFFSVPSAKRLPAPWSRLDAAISAVMLGGGR